MATVLFLAVTLLTCFTWVSSSKDDQPVRECGGQHVCTTLMRYKDGTTVDEGDNCICREGVSACSKEWDESLGESSLTWQHYERAHWTVQYRFCLPLFHDKNTCRPGEMAAIVETDIKKWEPFVSNPRCVCGSDTTFKIMGWKREGNAWKYFYQCDKEECPLPSNTLTGNSACATIYVDINKPTDKVLEVKFLCNCPDGYLCPAKFDEKADKGKLMYDETGHYVSKFCETVLKAKGGTM